MVSGDGGSNDDAAPDATVAHPAVQTPAAIEIAEFLAAGPEDPIADLSSVDCSALWGRYSAARDEAEAAGEDGKAAVYEILAGICSMDLRAGDPRNPFGALMAWATGSSPTPANYRGRQSVILGDLADKIANPALKARLGDVAWVNARNHAAARIAIDGYVESIERLLSKKGAMRCGREEASGFRATDLLRRACTIERQLGWKGGRVDDLAKIAKKVRYQATKAGNAFGFIRSSELELDFDTTRPRNLAKAAELLAGARLVAEDWEGAEHLWRLASRAYSKAGRKADAKRSLIELAERLVETADRHAKVPMMETHWLEQAIATLRRLPGTNARRAELQARLIRAQGAIGDYMAPITTSSDISDLVAMTRGAFAGKDLTDALLLFAAQSRSPDIAELRREALEAVGRSPFGSLFSSVIYDEKFRPTSRTPSAGGFGSPPNEDGLRIHIIQHEQMRRGLVVQGQVEPSRFQIMFDHAPNDRTFTVLAGLSPFVPTGHEAIFGRGFAHFFNADFLEAAHLLVPQLEASLRYLLNTADVDTTRIKPDFTQASATLSTLLELGGEMRGALESILGSDTVYEIENIFDHQAGPALRHRMAHGLLSQWSFIGRDAIYACWFIYRLCTDPLVAHADEVRRRLDLVS